MSGAYGTAMLISLQAPRMRRAATVLFAAMLLPTLWFGMRTYRSFMLLRSAYAAGMPATSNIRGWMTLRYIATTYHLSEDELRQRLELPPATNSQTSLRTLARRAGTTRPLMVQHVQRAIADATSAAAPATPVESSDWLTSAREVILTQLLVYGLPVLALTLFLGAAGVPLPTGIATAVAGSLAAHGRIDWRAILAIAAIASVLGDLLAYAIGHLLGGEILERHGRWIGVTPTRRARLQRLFEQWGALTVFITRTFVSSLSSLISLIAGVVHYRLSRYMAVAIPARLVWAGAYVGLGYVAGSDLDATSGFLTNLSLLLVSAMVLAASGMIAAGLTLQPRRNVA